MTNEEALHLLEQTKLVLSSLNELDKGIQAAMAIGWEEVEMSPREWSPRTGRLPNVKDVREILEAMGRELEKSDPQRKRDAVSVALIAVYYAIQIMKKGLPAMDWMKERKLAIDVFTDEQGRKPKLKP